MKILQVIPYFHWSYGGPVRVAHDVSRELVMRGHEVTIFTTDVYRGRPLNESEKIKLDGVTINYFKCLNNFLADKLKFHLSLEMLFAIKDNLKEFDLIHLHEYRSIPNLMVWYYSDKYNFHKYLQSMEQHLSTLDRLNASC